MKGIFFALTLCASSFASAALYTQDYGPTLPGYTPNDDGVFTVTLPSEFYSGTPYSWAQIYNNGRLYLRDAGWYAYVGLKIYTADLDSRNDPLGLANVYYRQEGDRAIITWVNMGYFAENFDSRVTAQMVIDASAQEVGFFYAYTGDRFGAEVGVESYLPLTYYRDNVFNYSSVEPLYFHYPTADQINGFSDRVSEVPEPGSLTLLALGVAGIVAIRRRK